MDGEVSLPWKSPLLVPMEGHGRGVLNKMIFMIVEVFQLVTKCEYHNGFGLRTF
jgi:hypothetical protein